MSKESLVKAIRDLANDDTVRSEAARLRDIFDTIEATLDAGVSRKAVLSQLSMQGFKMGMGGFKSTLQRLRKERRDACEQLPNRKIDAAPEAVIVSLPMDSIDKDEVQGSGGKLPIQQILNSPVRRQSYKSHLKKD